MSYTRLRRVQSAMATISNVGALSLLGVVLAYWSWVWWAPTPLPPAMAVAEPGTRLAAAGTLFGEDAGAEHPDVPTGLAVSLLGVVATEPAGSGFALLKLGAKDSRVVRAGSLLAPGIRVEKVLPQKVTLERNGVRETLAWPHPAPASNRSGVKP